jgi:hypothetical protein
LSIILANLKSGSPHWKMKSQHLLVYSLIVLTSFTGCVERFYPGEDDLKTGTLVINAHITDQPGMQVIEISRSSTLLNASFVPEEFCYALLEREDGEDREFRETKPGYYACDLDRAFLQTGMSYRLKVITPGGNEYQSDFDRIRPVPEIDSIYYLQETMSYQTEGDSIQGIRFYIDFTYDDEAYEYIRWELIETYEFHNPDMAAFVADSRYRLNPMPDTSHFIVCYITNRLFNIYSMSTRYLDKGAYIKKPFGFVPNDKIEQKLLYKYSLLVRQHSLGPEAFHYWNELKKTTQELGFLFDQQPALLKSNICNVNDAEEQVLGFFSMSGMKERRGIAENIPGLDHTPYKYYCLPVVKGPGSGSPTSFPAYFARATYDGKTVFAEVNKHCVDCRAYKGSTHIKPDYW